MPLADVPFTATRTLTTSDECSLGSSGGSYFSLCDTPFTYAHSQATHFLTKPFVPEPVLGYKATHLVYVTCDPMLTAMRAFHMTKTCPMAVSSLFCTSGVATASDFASPEWGAFALDSARQWMDMAQRFESFTLPKLKVQCEDLASLPAKTIESVVAFAGSGDISIDNRGLVCAYAVPKPIQVRILPFRGIQALTHQKDVLTVDAVFSPELSQQFCAIVKPRWQKELWGPRCT